MNAIAARFYEIGEPYAAGLFEAPEKGYFYRHAIANARFIAHLPVAEYRPGEKLYPSCNRFFHRPYAVRPQFAQTYTVNFEELEKKAPDLAAPMRAFFDISHMPMGWTHSTPNYKRILKEGLASYRERILLQKDEEFREGLLALIDAFKDYLERSVCYLRSVNAPAELIAALEKVPFSPAETYYEGLVAWNVLFHFDGGDNLGCLDDGLDHLYAGEDMTEVIAQLFDNLDATGNWSCTVGTKYNAVTEQALRAIGKKRRPMLELMVSPDMPASLWKMATANLKNGSTHPSFYNFDGITAMLHKRFPQIPEEELRLFCGCGCTETTLQGITRAGGTDNDVPLLSIFEEHMHEALPKAPSFEAFYEALCVKTENYIDSFLDYIMDCYLYEAQYLPNPIRTLFTDDCIDKGKDFNAGGARYTWTQSSESGLINVADSLLAIRELIFRKKQYTPESFLSLLQGEDPGLFARLKNCPCYGVDDEEADALVSDFAGRVYGAFQKKKPRAFIDGCLLTEHQFSRYERAGKCVGPTPDGRTAGKPACDSIAALRGKAVKGPTAMLQSAARLPQHLAEGISVLNLTLSKNFVEDHLEALIKGYFAMGGIQAQVTVTSAEELKDALIHPENHRDLVVRVGGYSEKFINLAQGLREAVVERNVHELG